MISCVYAVCYKQDRHGVHQDTCYGDVVCARSGNVCTDDDEAIQYLPKMCIRDRAGIVMDSRSLSYGKEKESRSRSGSTTPFGYVKGTLW